MTFPFSDLSGGGDGYMKFEIGSTAYIVESNRIVREVRIVKQNGNFYIVRFGTSGGIQVRGSRLFETAEAAESSIAKQREQKKGYNSPYGYLH